LAGDGQPRQINIYPAVTDIKVCQNAFVATKFESTTRKMNRIDKAILGIENRYVLPLNQMNMKNKVIGKYQTR
jgi:hypothetical protein